MSNYDNTTQYGKNRNLTRSRDAVNRYRLSRRKKTSVLPKIFALIFIVVFVLSLAIFGAYRFLQYSF